MKQRVKKDNKQNNISVSKDYTPKEEKETDIKKDYITDSDMDKMIDLFKKPDYGFKHDSQSNDNIDYDDNRQNKSR